MNKNNNISKNIKNTNHKYILYNLNAVKGSINIIFISFLVS